MIQRYNFLYQMVKSDKKPVGNDNPPVFKFTV